MVKITDKSDYSRFVRPDGMSAKNAMVGRFVPSLSKRTATTIVTGSTSQSGTASASFAGANTPAQRSSRVMSRWRC
jgi:hypothetical protein